MIFRKLLNFLTLYTTTKYGTTPRNPGEPKLKTALELIYRKAGWVQWGPDTIEVVLEPYRYPEQQQAMVETCRRFNAAKLRWRDGRRLLIRVAPP
jgi:hypothetical protein